MLISLLEKQTPLIDVRAPIEFKKGSLPGSVNLPILLDDAVSYTHLRAHET